MELKFDNHTILLSVFDNSKTILSKVASKLNTLPKYLIIENLENIKYDSQNNNVVDMFLIYRRKNLILTKTILQI